MDRERRRYWGKYLRDLANKLELRDWTICTAEVQADEGRMASMQCTYGRKAVTIRFGVGFESRDREEQRSTLVHELLHVHFWQVNQTIHDVQQRYSKSWLRMVDAAVTRETEYAVDAIADIVAPFMPLPPTEKPKKKYKQAKEKAA